jgi:pyruvate formate lyase activating enzyme
MIIGGLQKLTLIDYPDKVACTVFLAGCNFRCPFCYSSELVLPEKIAKQPKIAEKEFFNFLENRRSLLNGCVLCGGEPTVNKDLPEFVIRIKKLGYRVKLDTNGSNPEMLKQLIEKKLIDYVAMDIKAPKEKYSQAAGVDIDVNKIQKSIDILRENKIDYEFRSTIVSGVQNREDIIQMAKWIKGAKKYYLQNFRAEKTLNPKFEKVKANSDEYLSGIIKEISLFFEVCKVR